MSSTQVNNNKFLYHFTGSDLARKYHSITFFPYEDGATSERSFFYERLGALASMQTDYAAERNISSIFLNTWDTWHLIPLTRPVVNPPEEKKTIVEVPGSSDSLDISDVLAQYPTYKDRTGSFKFYVENGFMEWDDIYSDIMKCIHGQRMRFVLNDDFSFFYEGRVAVNSWSSDKERSTITLSYTVRPYKFDIFSSTEAVIWDLFDFRNGVDMGETFSGEYDFESDIPVAEGIEFNKNIISYQPTSSISVNDWFHIEEFGVPDGFYYLTPELLNIHPFNPIFKIDMNNTNGMQVYLKNEELVNYSSNRSDKHITIKTIGAGNQNEQIIKDPEFTLSGLSSDRQYPLHKVCYLWLQGNGKVKIIFRRGAL